MTKQNREFSVILPPPNLTGSLHIGHTWELFIIDAYLQYNKILNKECNVQTGFDHAGIITQILAKNKLVESGVDLSNISRERLYEACMDFAMGSWNTILDQAKTVMPSWDWSNTRFTMDDNAIEGVRQAFVKMYKAGLIYRANMLVNWDVKLQTAISDLECISKTVDGQLTYISYPVIGTCESIEVATTRPETIFADTAIAVHPDDNRWSHLIGKYAEVPIIRRNIKIIPDQRVDIGKGSGALKITPGHDFLDFEIGSDHGCEIISIISDEGKIIDYPGIPDIIVGLSVENARAATISALGSSVVKSEAIKHDVNYTERSGVVVEPIIKKQWFLATQSLADRVKEAITNGEIDIRPKRMKANLLSWMDNIKPWCISRQITWGHSIPAWETSTGSWIIAENKQDLNSQLVELGLTFEDVEQSSDVLDTWFSSGLWPIISTGWPQGSFTKQTHLMVTGYDILFFWVARMIMMCTFFTGKVPFTRVLLHGLIRDKKGNKMSKSVGNVIDPLHVIQRYNIDALRAALLYAMPSNDIRMSESLILDKEKLITKIGNFAKFCKMNNCFIFHNIGNIFNKYDRHRRNIEQVVLDCNKFLEAEYRASVLNKGVFTAEPEVKLDKLHQLSLDIILRTQETVNAMIEAMDDTRHNDAFKIVIAFFRHDVCDKYVEVFKALEQPGKVTVLSYVMYMTAIMLCPFMPNTAQEMVDLVADDIILSEESIHGKITPIDFDNTAAQDLYNIIHDIRFMRHITGIGMSEIYDIKILASDDNLNSLIQNSVSVIDKLARVKCVEQIKEFSDSLRFATPAGCTFDIHTTVDRKKSIKAINNKIASLKERIDHIKVKLQNQEFIAKAPKEVIKEFRSEFSKKTTHLKLLSSLTFEVL